MADGNEAADKVVENLHKDFRLVGRHRIHGWYAWAIIGVVFGMTIAIVYISNRSAQLVASQAQILSDMSTSTSFERGTVLYNSLQSDYQERTGQPVQTATIEFATYYPSDEPESSYFDVTDGPTFEMQNAYAADGFFSMLDVLTGQEKAFGIIFNAAQPTEEKNFITTYLNDPQRAAVTVTDKRYCSCKFWADVEVTCTTTNADGTQASSVSYAGSYTPGTEPFTVIKPDQNYCPDGAAGTMTNCKNKCNAEFDKRVENAASSGYPGGKYEYVWHFIATKAAEAKGETVGSAHSYDGPVTYCAPTKVDKKGTQALCEQKNSYSL